MDAHSAARHARGSPPTPCTRLSPSLPRQGPRIFSRPRSSFCIGRGIVSIRLSCSAQPPLHMFIAATELTLSHEYAARETAEHFGRPRQKLSSRGREKQAGFLLSLLLMYGLPPLLGIQIDGWPNRIRPDFLTLSLIFLRSFDPFNKREGRGEPRAVWKERYGVLHCVRTNIYLALYTSFQ